MRRVPGASEPDKSNIYQMQFLNSNRLPEYVFFLSFVCSFVRSFVFKLVCSFVRSFFCSCVLLVVSSFVRFYLFVCSFIRFQFVRLFASTFFCSCVLWVGIVLSFVFICSFVRSFVLLFIRYIQET